MPRDANGNYTLPSGNPVVTNTLITSVWGNDTINDLAVEMQDSLSRSGKGGFTAPVGVVDSNGAVPGLNFIAEPTSGLKRQAAEDVRIQVTATDVLQCTKTGVKALSGGALRDVVVEEPGLSIMRGDAGSTVCYFYNDTVPAAGWTLLQPDGNIRELVIGSSGAGQGGTTGGTEDPTNLQYTIPFGTVEIESNGATATRPITVDQLPAHSHGSGTLLVRGTTRVAESGVGVTVESLRVPGGGDTYGLEGSTAETGDDAAHDHNIINLQGFNNDNINFGFTPRYARGILATLD